MYPRGPIAMPGQRIGLLGGSFDPPHAGHLHISRRALAALGLDRVWWLVSPGNPLKPEGPAPFERRQAACRALADHPRITVTDIEGRMGTRYTVDTLARLRLHYSGVRFVWLMGADNLASFHRWHRWDEIMATTDIAVLARPGEQVKAGLSPAARRFTRRRLPQGAAPLLGRDGGGWCLLAGPMSPASSTAIRAGGDWK